MSAAVLQAHRPIGGGLRATTFMHTTPLAPIEPITFKKGARVRRITSFEGDFPMSRDDVDADVPKTPSSSPPIMKKPRLTKPSRRTSMDYSLDTPFEAHLQDIYAGNVDMDDGLDFFESHGYYDVSEANTVEMFRQNFGMKQQFWDGDDQDLLLYEEGLDTIDLAGLQVLSVGSLLSKKFTRNRTVSGRIQLLDDEGNEIDAEAQLEAEREKRMKLQHMEVDDDDLAELAEQQIVLAKAITVIRTEKTRFKRYFYQAFSDEMQRSNHQAVIPHAGPSLNLQLPPYSGYLYILKDTIPHLFRSWHKRWFFVDFNTGLAQMYKRSYWKSARGVLDMRTISTITRLNTADICIECYDGHSMLLRSKSGPEDADLWVNLLHFAKRQVGNVTPQPHQQLTTTTMTRMLTTTTTTTLSAGASHSLANSSGSFLISTKLRSHNDRNIMDVMSVLLQGKTAPNTITAA